MTHGGHDYKFGLGKFNFGEAEDDARAICETDSESRIAKRIRRLAKGNYVLFVRLTKSGELPTQHRKINLTVGPVIKGIGP